MERRGAAVPSVLMLMREFHPHTGGYQNQALRLARALVARGVGVHVVTLRAPGLAAEEVHDGIRIHRVRGGGRGHLAAGAWLLAAFRCVRVHRRDVDVIHAMRLSSGIVAGLIGAVLGKPVVCKLTGGDEIRATGFGRGLLGRAKRFCLVHTVQRSIALTRAIACDLEAAGVPRGRIARIVNGIESPALTARPTPAALGLPWGPDQPVVVFVGRLIPSKGVDWLLAAWAEVAADHRDARLLLVGDGPERRSLEALTARLGVLGSVRFAGARRDVERVLALADVFVLPSRHEGMSNAVLEAMAAGVPVVVANDARGGNRELVEDGVQGFVVPLEDCGALARAIARLLDEPALARAMGHRGRRTVQARYAMEHVADRYCALYEELARVA
jgi:glycosyltransferase involved in cell wall biosynthesis